MDALETVSDVNDSQIRGMQEALETLDSTRSDSSGRFQQHVKSVEAVVVYTYTLTAHLALRRPSKEASDLWAKYIHLCDSALATLTKARERFPDCGTGELYDLTIDHRLAASERYTANLQDAECQKLKIPDFLFPPLNSTV
jgi:hypothetical protein